MPDASDSGERRTPRSRGVRARQESSKGGNVLARIGVLILLVVVLNVLSSAFDWGYYFY